MSRSTRRLATLRRLRLLVPLGTLLAVSCSSGSGAAGVAGDAAQSSASTEAVDNRSASASEASDQAKAPTGSTDQGADPESSEENGLVLPNYEGPRRQTSQSVPHVQIDAVPNPELDAELRRRLFSLPGIEDRPSDRSLPGARGLAVVDHNDLARGDVIAGSDEFAHVHPDGSLHVWTSVPSAVEVQDKGWGELHPWVERDGFWPGVVMVFTPETADEVDVTVDIVVDAYNFVHGTGLGASDIP